MARDAGRCAHAPDQLLQLSDEMRGDHLCPGAAHLHDEVLFQAHLHHGGLFRPGVRFQDRATRDRIRRGRILDAAGHGLRARAARGRHPQRRGFSGHAGRRRGSFLLAARPDRQARRHRRRARRWRVLGGQAHRQGRREVRSQYHQETRTVAAQARHAEPGLLPDVLDRREDQHHPDRGPVPAGAVPDHGRACSLRQGLDPGPRRQVQEIPAGVGTARGKFQPAVSEH